MTYIQTINQLLKPGKKSNFAVLDLFAGCGGLSLGFESLGFRTFGYEIVPNYAATYNKNLLGRCLEVTLTESTSFDLKFDVVVGGPPCQPFSVGGHQKGVDDERNGFPAFINAVRRNQPKIWMFENVRGMMYANKWYLDKVINLLQAENYQIEYKLLNAVNFGVPQNRERLFVVGHRGKFAFPDPANEKTTVADAIGDLIDTINDESKILTESMDKYVAKYEKASSCVNPRDLYLDKPARTLTCRNIAAPTGDMQRVKLKDGRRRRISVREAARLQSLPDWFEFCGTENDQYYQIGNAVPPLLARQLALSFQSYLMSNTSNTESTSFVPEHRIPLQETLF